MLKKTSILFFFFAFLSLYAKAQKPVAPVLDSVSVDINTQNVIVGWHISNPDEVEGYLVKRQIFGIPDIIDGTFNNIAVIDDPYQFSYMDVSTEYNMATPGEKSEKYWVISYITDNEEMIRSANREIHNTIFLQPVLYDTCQLSNTLTWMRYHGWGNELNHYEVMMRTDDSADFVSIANVAATDSVFIHQNLLSNINYQYIIRAFHNDNQKTSTSNKVDVFSFQPEPPGLLYIDYASVLDENRIELSISTHEDKGTDHYLLQRKDTINTTWDTVAQLSAGQQRIQFVDSVISTTNQYVYHLLSVTSCNLVNDSSNIAGNIVLQVHKLTDDPGVHNLHWNKYTGWENGVSSYRVYRKIDDKPYELIKTLNDTSFTDNVNDYIEQNIQNPDFNGIFCYRIEGIESPDSPSEIQGKSFSNQVCVSLEPEINIPNAFNPNSDVEINRIFKPHISFTKKYQMIILNRLGNVIFETTNPQQGWDGTINNKPAKEGNYIYQIKYSSANNQTFTKQGNIVLIYK